MHISHLSGGEMLEGIQEFHSLFHRLGRLKRRRDDILHHNLQIFDSCSKSVRYEKKEKDS